MIKINSTSVVNNINPFGINDEMKYITLDEAKSFILSNINILNNNTYTFSVWHKANREINVGMNLFGNPDNFISNTTWNKFTSTFNVTDLENNKNIIFNLPICNIYLYEACLVSGTKDTDWTPAPEDVDEQVENSKELKVEILSSNGNIFKNDNIATTLTCRVYLGTTEVTSSVSSFTWIKIKDDGEVDETWNRATSSNVINLTNDDIDSRASFNCEIEIDI